jgi:tetratricopeptide (TPR) repeat protein
LLELALEQRPADKTNSVELEQRITALIYLVSLTGLYGQDERARALLAEATEAVKRLPADWNTIRSAIRTSVAVALAQHGNLVEAEIEFRALLQAAESRYGPAHRNLRTRLNNLGYALALQHKYGEAIPILERAVVLGERYGGPTDPALRDARGSLADALSGAGRLEEAGKIREQLYAEAVRDSGADHPFTLMVALGLADQYVLVGRGDEAVALATDTAERAARVFNPTHQYTLESRELAARGRFVAGQREAALAEMAGVCALKSDTLGADSPHMASCNAHRAELLADTGDAAGANRLLSETIERNAARYGANHPSTLALRERQRNLAGYSRDVGAGRPPG